MEHCSRGGDGPHCKVCGRVATTYRSFTNRANSDPDDSNAASTTQPRSSTTEPVLLCDACRKFYCRYKNRIQGETCTCALDEFGAPALESSPKCRVCRFKRCEAVVLERNSLGIPTDVATAEKTELLNVSESTGLRVKKVDFSKIPCSICGCSSSGFHFGAVSCEGCKGFFRRSVNQKFKLQYICKNEKRNAESEDSLCPQSSNCRKCRLKRCYNAGMSLSEVSIGRHTLGRRAEISATLKKHFSEGSFLKRKICRRLRNSVEDTPPSSGSNDNNAAGTFRLHQSEHFEESSSNASLAPGGNLCLAESERLTPVHSSSSSHQRSMTSLCDIPSVPSTSAGVSNAGGAPTTASSTEPFPLERMDDSEWLIEKSVEASALLAPISTVEIRYTYGMTFADMHAARMHSFEVYMKSISDFINQLPGIHQVTLEDKVALFTQAFFPVAIAQLSLHFNVETQTPNHFGLAQGETLEIIRSLIPYHGDIDMYLRNCGNQFASTIFNIKEFSLFCTLLYFNPEVANLQNAQAIQAARTRYELALLQYARANMSGAEERISRLYGMLTYFRYSTEMFHTLFSRISACFPAILTNASPLFLDFRSQVIKTSGWTDSNATANKGDP